MLKGEKLEVKQTISIEVKGLGKKIERARRKSDKTVEKICSELGVSKTYWYDLEGEKIKGALSYENLVKIEQILGVNFNVRLNNAYRD